VGLTAQQIADLLQPGSSGSYHETGSTSEKLTSEFKARTATFNRLVGKMESAWTGDSSDSAAQSLAALQEATNVSAENLHNVSMQMNTQGESFSKVKNEVGSGPGPQPQETFASNVFPMFTDQDEKISRWNEEAQRVVDAYNTYSDGTSQNANVFPSTYGELTGSPEGLKFSVEDSGGGGKRISDPGVGGNGSTGTSSASSSGGSGGGGSASVPSFGGGAGGAGAGGSSGATSPSAGGLTPGSSSGVGAGLPPGAIRLPDGSIQYPDGTIRTPDGRIIPPGGTRASSRGFGPGAGRDGLGGAGGAGAAAAAGMMGGGMMGGVAGGGDTQAPRSGFGPGGGSSSGAGPGAGAGGMGAKAVPGGMGRGGMGMGGMMGGGGAGRGGGGDDDKEHKDEYYIRQEMDPGLKTEIDEYGEKLVDESTGMTVVPPVIGE
jgi:uncharacterized protein YukE